MREDNNKLVPHAPLIFEGDLIFRRGRLPVADADGAGGGLGTSLRILGRGY